jgi:hypothetical protein
MEISIGFELVLKKEKIQATEKQSNTKESFKHQWLCRGT